MTAVVELFEFQNQSVRFVLIDGEPHPVLADLCGVLDIENSRNVAARLDPLNVRRADVENSRGQMRQTVVVNEAGMYEVIFRSDKPEAVEFRRWVTGEVLPQIRKTGQYGASELDLSDPIAAIEAANARSQQAVEIAKAERAMCRALQAQAEVDRPLVERAKTHAAGSGSVNRTDFGREVVEWAEEQGIRVLHKQIREFLARKLHLFVAGDRSDNGHATTDAIRRGLCENRRDTRNGRNVVTGLLTPGGQAYAWERITRYINANGTLELPREIGGRSA